jgi:hypothetical protein
LDDFGNGLLVAEDDDGVDYAERRRSKDDVRLSYFISSVRLPDDVMHSLYHMAVASLNSPQGTPTIEF